ncbi:MAG: sulfite exporter TauE/SafE family protein, partial [Acidimicrobiia bacterium]|nr:sulfite exporter TauE/SafE family protein [Acidimicrobiia bacterium]
RALFRRLVVPGVVGAAVGAYLLSSYPGEAMRPWVSTYLLIMGVVLVIKSFRTFPPVTVSRHVAPLGFAGAFVDAIGGGGWGPIVASTLIARGADTRKSVGTVASAEFFVTLAASLTFLVTIGLTYWKVIAGLAIGGAIAAPLGAYLCTRVPVRPLIAFVGVVVILLSLVVLRRYAGF